MQWIQCFISMVGERTQQIFKGKHFNHWKGKGEASQGWGGAPPLTEWPWEEELGEFTEEEERGGGGGSLRRS